MGRNTREPGAHHAARQPQSHDRRRDFVWISAALLVALAIRLLLASRTAGLTMDSLVYVDMAEHMLHGERALGYQHHGYSGLIAIASVFGGGRELPGRVVSFVAGLALIPVAYLLARRRMPAAGAGLAAGLVAAHPLLGVYASAVMSESVFVLLIFGGLLLAEMGRRLLGGAALGLGYVVRPEGATVAAVAGALGRWGRRGAVIALVGFALAIVPYVGYLRWSLSTWTATNKTFLFQPIASDLAEREFRVVDARQPVAEPERSFAERVRWAAPSVARSYLPQLAGYLPRLLEAWPVPLLVLSAIGITRGAVLAPLLCLLLLPLVPLPPNHRFLHAALPALAILAALGALRLATAVRWRGLGAPAAAVVAVLGVIGLWTGPAARHALHFDDGPMRELRATGAWLAAHGRPHATVMDRKAYVAFFSGMRHTQLPDDPYETIVDFARRSRVDYLVVEEYVAELFRPQLLPLVADPAFRERERRLRLVHTERGKRGTGVAVFAVVPEPLVAEARAPAAP